MVRNKKKSIKKGTAIKIKPKSNGSSGLIFHDARLIIYPAPKAARTSIMRTLAGVYQERDEHLKKAVGRLKFREACDVADYYIIGICRNPWVRLQSIYVEKMIERKRPRKALRDSGFYRHMPFPAFIRKACSMPDENTEKHLRSQYRTLYQCGRLDHIIKFECLEEGWLEIQKLFFERGGSIIPSLQKFNVTKTKKPKWKSQLIDIVAERYERDIQLFGYVEGRPG